jgi:lipopolysaccharide/colanic/teichoic acid biosynthesis glycosyltransferase
LVNVTRFPSEFMKMKPRILLQKSVMLFDALLICGSGALSFEMRAWFGETAVGQSLATTQYLVVAALVSLLAWSATSLQARSILHASRSDVILIAGVSIIGPLAALAATFILDRSLDVARSIPVFHILLVFLSLVGLRAIARTILAKLPVFLGHHGSNGLELKSFAPRADQHGANTSSQVLVVGRARNVANYLRALETVHGAHFEVAGVLISEEGLAGCDIRGAPVLGHCDTLPDALAKLQAHGTSISQIILTNGTDALPAFVADYLVASHINVFDFEGFFVNKDDNGQESSREETPSYVLKSGPRKYAPLKRGIDIVASSMGLIVSSPIILLTAIFVRLVLGAPIMFWQWRPGKDGRSFKLIKFRSMRNPIDKHGNVLSDEARLGLFGRLLRRTRFDELPQLFNILMGDMSLIGPRPLIQEQQEKGGLRLSVRPGLSGWAQVHGGHLVAHEQKLAMDLWYVDHSSLWLDIKIVFLTARVIAFGDQPELADTLVDTNLEVRTSSHNSSRDD